MKKNLALYILRIAIGRLGCSHFMAPPFFSVCVINNLCKDQCIQFVSWYLSLSKQFGYWLSVFLQVNSLVWLYCYCHFQGQCFCFSIDLEPSFV